MGASPAWMLLSLVMPRVDDHWLRAFSDGLGTLAVDHNVALVGGNLSRGPLSITIQLAGVVPAGRAYQEWHEPRVLTRIVYFYFDPARLPVPGSMPTMPETSTCGPALTPWL